MRSFTEPALRSFTPFRMTDEGFRMTIMKRKIPYCLLLTAWCLLFFAGVAKAQGGGGVTAATNDAQQLVNLVSTWYNNLLLPLGTILAGIMIAFGGITYAASGGDPTKAQKGKEYIFGAIIGLVLLILAALIVRTIIG